MKTLKSAHKSNLWRYLPAIYIYRNAMYFYMISEKAKRTLRERRWDVILSFYDVLPFVELRKQIRSGLTKGCGGGDSGGSSLLSIIWSCVSTYLFAWMDFVWWRTMHVALLQPWIHTWKEDVIRFLDLADLLILVVVTIATVPRAECVLV